MQAAGSGCGSTYNLQGPLDTIAQAFWQGTAVGVTDGSYNLSLSPWTSGVKWLIYCSHSHRTLVTGSFFEDHPLAAGSYRRELLGLVALHFFALAIKRFSTSLTGLLVRYAAATSRHCSRRNGRPSPRPPFLLPTTRSCVYLQARLRPPGQVQTLAPAVSVEAQLNCRCDEMAMQAVYRGHQVELDSSSQLLPHEAASVFIDGVKQTSDLGANLRFHAGSVEARRYYLEKRGWDAVAFDNTDLSSLNDTLATKPKMFHAWLCKQAVNYPATGTNTVRLT